RAPPHRARGIPRKRKRQPTTATRSRGGGYGQARPSTIGHWSHGNADGGGATYDQRTMATRSPGGYNAREIRSRHERIRVEGVMTRWRASACSLLVIAVLGVTSPAPAITQDEFRLRSGADVVALCSTPASDPLYTAAVHMCHGFGAGTYQTIMAMTRH